MQLKVEKGKRESILNSIIIILYSFDLLYVSPCLLVVIVVCNYMASEFFLVSTFPFPFFLSVFPIFFEKIKKVKNKQTKNT